MRERESTKAAIISKALALAPQFERAETALYRAMDTMKINNRAERMQLFAACVGEFRTKFRKRSGAPISESNSSVIDAPIVTESMMRQAAAQEERERRKYDALGLDNPGY